MKKLASRGVVNAFVLALSTGALWLGTLAGAQPGASELAVPTGRVVLRVHGAISNRNAGTSAAFDRAQLEALPQFTLHTTTPWTDGETEFVGPLGRDLLSAVGASGKTLRAKAVNDYQVQIPIADFNDYDVVIAIMRNGKRMSVRDKGPLWVIYPWSQHPKLRTERYHSRSIWQLKELTVE